MLQADSIRDLCIAGALIMVCLAGGCSERTSLTDAPPAPREKVTNGHEVEATVDSMPTQSPPTERAAIYDPAADGPELITAALAKAARDKKHVLVKWGGNWCGWCYKLHDVFHNNPVASPILADNYELVMLDSTVNRTLMEQYGGSERQYTFPHLTVLDADGNVLVNQHTEPLETGDHHDPDRVAEFLRQWMPVSDEK